MTGKVINLNRARKDRARTARRQAADENAVKFGRTRTEQALDGHEAGQLNRHLDHSKRDDCDD